MSETMTPLDVALAIGIAARAERQPKRGAFKRLLRALQRVGCSPAQQRAFCETCDLLDRSGAPYNKAIPPGDCPWL